MRERELGTTGIRISEVGLGTWAMGGPIRLGDVELGWGAGDDRKALATIDRALELGVNFFDMADLYGAGHSEELVGQALRGRRDEAVLATKLGNRIDAQGAWTKDFSAGYLGDALEASLRRLRTDHVDILLLHCPPPELELSEELFAPLEALRQDGKIRFFGLSAATLEQAEAVADAGLCDVVELPYNLVDRAAEVWALPAASTADMGVIVRSALGSGLLTGKYDAASTFAPDDWRSDRFSADRRAPVLELVDRLRPLATEHRSLAQAALQFVLRHPAVSTVAVGARTPEQVTENVAATNEPLAPEALDLIEQIWHERQAAVEA